MDNLLLLDAIADSINPSLLVLALIAPWIQRRRPPWAFWGCTFLSLVVVYVIQFLDHQLMLWPRAGLDYSTHTAFAVAVIVSLGAFDRRWFFILLPVLIAYATLMMYLEYHSLADILTAALVIGPPTWLIHRIGRRRRTLGTGRASAR
jgi:hypothetical protein